MTNKKLKNDDKYNEYYMPYIRRNTEVLLAYEKVMNGKISGQEFSEIINKKITDLKNDKNFLIYPVHNKFISKLLKQGKKFVNKYGNKIVCHNKTDLRVKFRCHETDELVIASLMPSERIFKI